MSVVSLKNITKNRWSTDETFELIEVVKTCSCFYNSSDKNYYSRAYNENLWHDIDIKFGKNPGSSLSKWTNLRISFRREYMTLMKKHTKPTWIFFDKMLFLREFLRRKKTRVRKLDTDIEKALVQISSITRRNFKNYAENDNLKLEPEEASEKSWNQKDGAILSGDEENPEIRNTSDSSVGSENGIEIDETMIFKQLSAELNENSNNPNESLPITIKEPTESVIENNGPMPSSTVPETFCTCKTNADVMFLMSLMPDIQLLSRKDKGKFKIEVQKIIQNLLYPD